MKRLLTVLVGTFAMMSVWSGPAMANQAAGGAARGRPMLVALQPGVEITPIINSGDPVGDDFQYTGVPDGIGVYESASDRLEVFTNHELSYRYGDPAWSRVSHLTLDADGGVVSASYAVDGTERYEYFCSSTMAMIDGVPWYFTGEEWFASPRGGMSIAVNALTGKVRNTPQFGSLNHENVVPVQGLDRAVFYLSEDSFRLRSQAYAYFADDFPAAIHGDGAFAVWVPDDQGDGDPSTNDIDEGQTLSGRFVNIPHADRYTGLQLNEKAEALGSFNFIRIEDAATDASTPGVVYFADTGANKAESKHGRLYRMTFDPANPRHATLEVVLDGDAGDDIVNPDNLGIDERVLLIQEDRNDTASGYNRVLMLDLTSGALTPVARLDPSPAVIERSGPGAWESSGVVDVSAFFGPGAWLLSVQAHHTSVLQQGLDLGINSAKGQRGQLVLLRIPGS
ncbi:MAG: hypothetical protein ACXWX5_04240 [Actinomycetota bacterium]